jgi:hypothetical protein
VLVVGCALLVKVRVPLTAPVAVGVKVTVNGTLLPAAIVVGSDSPLMVNAPLLELPAVTVTLAPVAVSVPEAVPFVPTTTLPTAIVPGLTVSCPAAAAVPVPESGMVSVGFEAFEVIVTLPVKLVAVLGANLTLKVVLAPAARLTGVVIPLSVNPVPLIVAAEIVTDEPPVFVIFSDSDWLLPTVTLPKLRLAGLGDSDPADSPVPDRGMLKVGFDAFDVIVTVPLALPAAVGVYVTVKLVLAPAANVTGVVMPLSVNPLPLIVAEEIVTDDPPVFVIFSVRAWLLPTVTLPKLRLVGFGVNVPAATPVPVSGMVRVGFEAFEPIVTLPLASAAVVGVNVTLNVVLAPAARVTGVVSPLRLNPVPLTATEEIVTDVPPVFVIFSDRA